jgi:putative ABC transport system substrate-binding protein
MPIVGFLSNGSAETRRATIDAFHQGLAESGYIDGKNVAVEIRWAGDDYDRFPELTTDLMRRPVAVIVASGLNAALASKRLTATIPIIFGVGDDPVKHGLVTSFNHPGSNATGVSIQIAGLIAKRLSLLRELVGDAPSIAVLVNPNDANTPREIAEIREASNALKQPIELLSVKTERDIEPAFASLVRTGAKGLVLGVEQFFVSRRIQLVGLADRYGIPTIYALRAFVEAGGLVSYGPDLAYGDRQLGIYAGKILAGANPGDLPVVQTHKFELAINLKTANALGLTIPLTILGGADDVIE